MNWSKFELFVILEKCRYRETLEQVAGTISFQCFPSHLLHGGQIQEGGVKPAEMETQEYYYI